MRKAVMFRELGQDLRQARLAAGPPQTALSLVSGFGLK